ncbi:hypothetical protein chiPu_0004074 [Chiloscyllium punctatum]|uniref:small monomeric GTPase n=1 Tax=Chiloscyllium punctatum TaxID=137246 RepID=A0A401S5I4_CHIPU|nr:hypothetical protein [Chiloscyllium punctatum]
MFGKVRGAGGSALLSERDKAPLQATALECNVGLLGCPGSGKSALTVKFLTKRFISEYDPNLEDTYTTEEIVDHQPILLKIMDTADQVIKVSAIKEGNVQDGVSAISNHPDI